MHSRPWPKQLLRVFEPTPTVLLSSEQSDSEITRLLKGVAKHGYITLP